jgi:hypothetical protein
VQPPCPRFGVMGCKASPMTVTQPLPTLPFVHLHSTAQHVSQGAGCNSTTPHHNTLRSNQHTATNYLQDTSHSPTTSTQHPYLSLMLLLLILLGSVCCTASWIPHDHPWTADRASATPAAAVAGLGASCAVISSTQTGAPG